MVFDTLEDMLMRDTSPFALDANDQAALHQMIIDSRDTIVAGIPKGTLAADNNGAKWAARFCLKHDTPFVRPLTLATHADRARESFMYARFTVETAREMAPRSKHRRSEDGQIITDAKPCSALGPLYGWRRILRDGGCELPDLASVRSHMKGEVAKFKKAWGAKALVPERRMPFSQPHLHVIARVLDNGEMSSEAGWSQPMHAGISTAFKYGLSSGARADELTSRQDGLRRSSFVLMRGQAELEMTPENLRAARNGDFIRGRAAPSKCDRDAMEWGDRNMWFRVNLDDPLNFAAAYIRWELDYPCPVEQRAQWAAFSPDGGCASFTTDALQRRFGQVLVVALGELEASRRSFHALRVTAATALSTKKRPDGAIQAVIRWKTLEAMRLYAKMDATQYADLVDEITTTQIDVTKVAALPALGPDDTLLAMQEALEDLQLDEADAAAWLLDGQEPKQAGGAGGAKQRRGAQAGPSGAQAGAAVAPSTRSISMDGEDVEVLLRDPHELAGKEVRIHNSLWTLHQGDEWDPEERSTCTVIGPCAALYHFNGARKARAYIVQCNEDGYYYPIKESALLSYFPKQRAKGKKRAA